MLLGHCATRSALATQAAVHATGQATVTVSLVKEVHKSAMRMVTGLEVAVARRRMFMACSLVHDERQET